MSGIITITTDFGLTDPYVGAMKGAVLSVNPGVQVVDITHLVPTGDVTAGAIALLAAFGFYPPGTIHVAVVDPGVGGPRRAIAIETARYRFVGPDNGVLSLAANQDGIAHVVELADERYFRAEVSPTFHGRDIFGPVAAHLSLGVDLAALGPKLTGIIPVSLPEPVRTADGVVGEVVSADSFGNLITNIERADMPGGADPARAEIEIKGRVVHGMVNTYGKVDEGELAVLFGSTNRLEVACNRGNAASVIGAGAGDTVTVRFRGEAQ